MDFVAGPVIVLCGESLDAELTEADEGPPYLRTLLVLSFVSCVGSGVGRGLVLVDWTSSLGEMSSNVDFLKVKLSRVPSMVRDCERSVSRHVQNYSADAGRW